MQTKSPAPDLAVAARSGIALAVAAILCQTLAIGDDAVAAPATRPDRLIVRTRGGPWRSNYEAAAASFTAKTGIPVEFDVTDFNEIQVKVGQAVSAGAHPSVDVLLTIEAMAFAVQVQAISIPPEPHLVESLDQLSSVAIPAGAPNSRTTSARRVTRRNSSPGWRRARSASG